MRAFEFQRDLAFQVSIQTLSRAIRPRVLAEFLKYGQRSVLKDEALLARSALL